AHLRCQGSPRPRSAPALGGIGGNAGSGGEPDAATETLRARAGKTRAALPASRRGAGLGTAAGPEGGRTDPARLFAQSLAAAGGDGRYRTGPGSLRSGGTARRPV